ncbi:MAG: LUD domain-containing protein [Candidatus Doudnabacteria bacterium]|nr:LUD domain-containing protein [Candidatus Doudnabacteria bacterium]
MKINKKFAVLASDKAIKKTALALNRNGIETFVVDSGKEAKKKILELIPHGAEVMNMTSKTLETINAVSAVLESGRYQAVRHKLAVLDKQTQKSEMKKLRSAPAWAIGSVHAVTFDGQVVAASESGSQFGAYAYGAGRVVWVVGAQKIVKNFNQAIKRVYEYSLPLENQRVGELYGEESAVAKLLVINQEKPGRIVMIIVKEKLGF